ncbi:hypothetical protein [Amycolatopsis sp. NPDC001319]|uniref:hypothetical protein n=1 Tax=unclassified Amycolatopsis TaxID=2618356 RepID=UPI003676B2D3
MPFRARLTWLGLWTQCDDHGRFKDNAKLIKASVWPLDPVSLREVEEDLAVLAREGRIVRYIAEGKPLLVVTNWHFHQNINRPGRPNFPAPPVPMPTPAPGEPRFCPVCWDDLMTHGGLTEGSHVDNSTEGKTAAQDDSDDSVSVHRGLTLGKEGKGKEGKGDASSRTRPSPRCPDHENTPKPPPCRRCGEARRAAEAWETEHAVDARAAVRRCQMCDGEGFRWDPVGRHRGPTRDRCDHRPMVVAS